MNLVFNPFIFDNKRVLLNDQFIGPDINFFNGIICNNTYLCENEFFKSFSLHTDINNLSRMHINCRSLFKNFNHICALLINSRISILAVTETWLSDMANYTANVVVIPGYKFINQY